MSRINLIVLICLFFQMQSFLQSPAESPISDAEKRSMLNFNGYVRASVFAGGEIHDFANVFSEVKLAGDAVYRQAILKADLRVRTGIQFGENDQKLEIKELYGAYKSEKIHVTLGNQIVEWGRADGINPTGNLTPKNYFFLSGDMDDQLISNFMFRLKYILNPNSDVEITAMPYCKPSEYRYDLIPIGQNVQFNKLSIPDFSFSNIGFGSRLNFDYPKAGFALSYFNGYSTLYGFDLKNLEFETDGKISITNSPMLHKKQTAGIDFAIPASVLIIRGEAAFNLIPEAGSEMYIPQNDLVYVLGIEKEILGMTFILQYFGRYTPDFTPLIKPNSSDYNLMDPMEQVRLASDLSGYEMRLFNRKIFGQQNEFGHSMTVFLTRSFAYDAVKTELAFLYDFKTEEFMIRPKLVWNIGDQIDVSFGGNYISGPEKSLFDYSKGIMNGFFMDFRVHF